MRRGEEISAEEKFYVASQWQLMWRKFVKHKLAIFGGTVLIIFYIIAIFCEFFSTQDIHKRNSRYAFCPPQKIHFFDRDGFHLRPFVYQVRRTLDPVTWKRIYTVDKTERYPIYFFIHGDKYRLWNLFSSDIHLFGVKKGTLFLFGTDNLGRDLFSRTLYAARISLSIGLVGVFLSFVLGCILGGISGYFGGAVDMTIQRIIEFLISIPTIPLWMALSAALPQEWSPIRIYFSIVIILSLVGWCGLARVVRGKLLELREEDFCMAAKIAGASDGKIIMRHLLPSFLSYLIVNLTLSIPWMILGETSLSFLGLGLRPPVVSWGVLLEQAQNFRTVVLHPWLLIPGIFVVITVLAFNFLGDGLRDAADPYK
ncbi:ABC transporter permease [Candidatus Aerophobetes bacterium]|uniref:ABC transporter permease n=1 Tax=Aerophobetes bacterium TaxID=2030807 RepID=A0A497E471_UNCAE|nr:MAG: ABC transporter permease [Candidatus Aerophobetes bacterium]